MPVNEQLIETPEAWSALLLPEDTAKAESGRRIDGVVVGTLTGLTESGQPLVELPTGLGSGPLPARSTVALGPREVGHQVVIQFEGGNPRRPIILGILQETGRKQVDPLHVEMDGEKIVFTAERE